MKKHALILSISLVILAWGVPSARGEFGDILKTFKSATTHDKDYYGGITWKDGYLCENVAKTTTIYLRDPDTGEVKGTINVDDQAKDAGLAWDEDHKCWWIAEPWETGLGKLPAAGGRFEFTWTTKEIENIYGISYDPIEKVLLVSRNGVYTPTIKKLEVNSYPPKIVGEVPVGYGMRGVTRANNRYWVSQKSEVGPFYVNELTLEGKETGRRFTLPEGKEAWELAYDGKELWVRSNNVGGDVYIYRVQISDAPAPTPPPISVEMPSMASDLLHDYNGDNTPDPAIFRPSTGLWIIRGISKFYLGNEGDIPVPADYNGDGTVEAAIFRPRTGLWKSRAGFKTYFGRNGDTPIPHDFNGDGTDEPAYFRPSWGLWKTKTGLRYWLGKNGDVPLVADFSGDGIPEIGYFRPSTRLWKIRGYSRFFFGLTGDYPVPGHWLKESLSSPAVYRPETGLWIIRDGNKRTYGSGGYLPQPAPWNWKGICEPTAYFLYGSSFWWASDSLGTFQLGESGDIPVGARYFLDGGLKGSRSISPEDF